MMRLSDKAFTLIESMLVVAISLIAIVGLLFSYVTCIALSMTTKNTTIALSGANAKIEEIRNNSFDTFVGNYSPGGIPGNSFIINNWLSSIDQRGAVEIADPATGQLLNTSSSVTPGLTLYEVRVTVSWREKGGRIIGEDSNFNGILDTGEDTNSNNQLDSPVKIVTLISRRP